MLEEGEFATLRHLSLMRNGFVQYVGTETEGGHPKGCRMFGTRQWTNTRKVMVFVRGTLCSNTKLASLSMMFVKVGMWRREIITKRQ